MTSGLSTSQPFPLHGLPISVVRMGESDFGSTGGRCEGKTRSSPPKANGHLNSRSFVRCRATAPFCRG